MSIGSSLNLTNAVMEDNYAYTAHGAAVVIRSVPKSGEIVMNNVTIVHSFYIMFFCFFFVKKSLFFSNSDMIQLLNMVYIVMLHLYHLKT